MSATVSYCILIVSGALVLGFAGCAPNILSDSNLFLESFVSENLLNVLGVILAITLASAGNLHLTLVQIEERLDKSCFDTMRKGIRIAANYLIGIFLFAVVLTVLKPALAKNAWSQTLFNGAALFLLLWYILILISLTHGVLAIKAEIKEG